MSGPKLMGITCDPEIIRRNQERLRKIGKQAYYMAAFEGVNEDILNTQKWVKEYGRDTISSIIVQSDDIYIVKNKIEDLKNTIIDELENEKLNNSIIEPNSIDKLSAMVCNKIKNIPKWKKHFMQQMSPLFEGLQYEVQKYQRNREEQLRKYNEFTKKMENIVGDDSVIIHKNERGEVFADLDYALKRQDSDKDKKEDVEQRQDIAFTLEEMALIETMQRDMKKYCEELDQNEKNRKHLNEINQNINKILLEDSIYDWDEKRKLLHLIKYDYHILNKKIATLYAERENKVHYRASLENQYVSFCKALGKEEEIVGDLSEQELEEKISDMQELLVRQEQRIYIEEQITEIMQQYGYSGVSAINLHDSEKTSRIYFEDGNQRKICSAFGDGVLMLQVVGEGEHPPTKSEKEVQVKEQGAFCELYPEIKKELKKRHINIQTETCMPISQDSATNVKIERQESIRKSTKRFSVIHRTYQVVDEEEQRLVSGKEKYMYRVEGDK